MNKRIIILILSIALIIFSLHIIKPLEKFLDTDVCLDVGLCKQGLKLNINSKEVAIKEQTCVENNGKWREKILKCSFY